MELLVVIVVIVIIAAIAIPGLLAYRRSANEGSAIATLRTLHNAELTYQATNRQGNFAGSLSVLRDVSLIDSALAAGAKNGYAFFGDRIDSSSDSLASVFYSAVPIKSTGIDRSGTRRFGVSTDGVIHFSELDPSTHFESVAAVESAPALTSK